MRERYGIHFNCTIQELKQVLRTKYEIERQTFQLHHTGIKTIKSVKIINKKC